MLLVSDWTNQFGALDVSRDGSVSPLDALIGINELNERTFIGSNSALPSRSGREALPFYDVNGDAFLSPLDVLIVVNAINDGFVRPAINVSLLQDTAAGGTTNNDLLTSNPNILGGLSNARSKVTRLTAQVDGSERVDVTVETDGSFSFETPLALDGSTDGQHVVRMTAFQGPVILHAEELPFTLDTQAPTVETGLAGTINVKFSEFTVAFTNPIAASAFDPDSYSLVVEGGANNGQTVAINTAEQIDGNNVRIQLAAPLANQGYRFNIDPLISDLAGNVVAGPIVSSFIVAQPTHVSQFDPANAEEFVSPERDAIVRFDGQVDPATVDSNSFYLVANGERVPGTIRVSATERFATFVYTDPLPASTEIRVVVDGDAIMGRDGLPLDADGDGAPGGMGTADFRTLPLTRIPGTEIFGYVYDSYNKNPDGSDIPIVGATIRVDAFPDANVVTDENGYFELVDMPAPVFFVHIDGTTATTAPAGAMYPSVGKPFHTEPGQRIQLNMMGVPFNVYLPPMGMGDIATLSPTADTDVGFGAAGMTELATMFPDIDPALWERVKVTYPAGSAIDDAGNFATQAVVIPVPPDRIPAPLPSGLAPQLVISVQALGASTFDTPAPITFPNLDGLAPGEQAEFFSFNHDAGRWDAIGTGTVSADGLMIVSDPGVGVRAPGWHGVVSGVFDIDRPTNRNNPDRDYDVKELDIVDCVGPLIFARRVALELGIDYAYINNGPMTAIHFAHFLAGSGDPIEWPNGSLGSELARKEFDHKSILRETRLELSEALNRQFASSGAITRVDLELEKILARKTVKGISLGGPDIHTAVNGVQGLVVTGDIHVKEGRFVGGLTFVYLDTYGFGRDDASAWQQDGWAREQQLCGYARPFRVEIYVDEPFDEPIGDPPKVAGESGASIGVGQLKMLDEAPQDVPMSTSSGFGTDPNIHYRIEFDNGFVLAGVSAPDAKLNAFLPPQMHFRAVFYSPSSNRWMSFFGTTGRSGEMYQYEEAVTLAPQSFANRAASASSLYLEIFGGLDVDLDGIPDAGEIAMGTDPDKADTDGDGISDSAELDQGLNPLDGLTFTTGIVSGVALRGEARELVVEGSLTDSRRQTAYVATGSYGLAVVDVSDFQNPIVQGRLDLPGENLDIAVDPQRGLAAVVTGRRFTNEDGNFLHIVDISDPMTPRLVRTVSLPAAARAVEIVDGTAYVGTAYTSNSVATLLAVDLVTGDFVDQQILPVGGTAGIEDLQAVADELFVLSQLRLHAFQISGHALIPLGSTQYPASPPPEEIGGQFFVGGGLAYVGTFTGYIVIDVSDPTNPVRVSQPATTQLAAHDIAANGSGLVVVDSSNAGPDSFGVSLYDGTDPTDVTRVLTTFATPGDSPHLALASGIAVVAQRDLGLKIINYLPFDAQGQSPTVRLIADTLDVDSAQPGIQIIEGSTIRVDAEVRDDVQVRNVELLVGGRVVRNEVSFPFDLSAIVPILATGTDTTTIQLRATDTGGNSALSEVITVEIVADTFGPQILATDPVDGATRNDLMRAVRVFLSEPLEQATINATNFQVLNGSGQSVPLTTLSAAANSGLLQLGFDQLPSGEYRLVVRSSAVTDRAGQPIGSVDKVLSFTVNRAITLTPVTGDADPGRDGYQAVDGGSFTLTTATFLQQHKLRSYEFLVNGAVVSSSTSLYGVSLPQALNFFVPDIGPVTSVASVQLRAITTTGTAVMSNLLTLELVPDTRPFSLVSANPPDGAIRGRNLQTIDLNLSKRPDPSTITPANFMILDGNDQPIALTGLTIQSGQQLNDTVSLAFDPLPEGEYRLVIKASSVMDRYGNALSTVDLVSRFSRRAVQISVPDFAAATPGPQVLEAFPLTLSALKLETLDLSQVELLLDGQVVQSDGAFQASYSVTPPPSSSGSFTLQLRGMLTDGTPFTSNLLMIDVLPALALTSSVADADPVAAGLQVYEGTSIPFVSTRRQSAIINSSELLVNGLVSQSNANLPSSYSIQAPPFDAQSTTFDVEVRAGTTTGLSLTSDRLTFELLDDIVAPMIQSITPADGARVGRETTSADIVFSEPVLVDSVTSSNFRLLDIQGNAVPLTGVAIVPGTADRTVRMSFDSVSSGEYQIVIRANAVFDRGGNSLGAADITNHFTVKVVLQWLNPLSGDWDDPENWDLGFVPTANDDAVLLVADVVTVNSHVIVDGLDLVFSTLSVNNTLEVTGSFELPGPATLTGTGDVMLSGPSSRWAGAMTGVGRTRNTGTLRIGDTESTTRLDERTFDNAGTVIWDVTHPDPFVLGIHATNNAAWNNLPGSLFDAQIDGRFFGNDAGAEPAVFNNAGTIRKSAGTGTSEFSLSVVNTGTIDVQVGTFVSEVAVLESTTSTGAFMVAADATLVLGGTQTLTDASSVTGDGSVTLAGATTINGTYDVRGGTTIAGSPVEQIAFDATPIDLGANVTLSSGQLRITGNYVQTETETLNVAVGRFSGHQFGGSLVATEQAQLAGELNVSLVPGYVPVVGDSFPILAYGSRVGQFATINGLDLGDGKLLAASYNATNLTLQVVSGSGLRLAGETRPTVAGTELLDRVALVPLLEQTRAWWIAAGAESSQLDAISIRLADLPGNLLGYASHNEVWLDYSAAGQGWYLPGVESDDSLVPANRVDLATVLSHELGHLLGLEHSEAPGLLMSESLSPGVRYRLWAELVDEFFVEN